MPSTPNHPSKVKRLGVLGGSFDPIHLAHLLMAETARETLSLDLVLFVPVREQPLKLGKEMAPVEHRVAMVQLAIAGNRFFALSRVDVDRPGPSYTEDTLRLLREEWAYGPDLEMWLISGADSFASLPRWHDPRSVLEQARMAVIRRPGVNLDVGQLEGALPGISAYIDWVDAPLLDISATDIRLRACEGRSLRYRVPEAVREYIEASGLYKD